MRAWIALAAAIACAACGARDRRAEPAAAVDAAPPPAAAASPEFPGLFLAASEAARTQAGDVEIDDRSLSFDHGLGYATAVIGPADLDAPSNVGGAPLRALFAADGRSEIGAAELRRVTAETVAPSAPGGGLCGETPVSHMVLAVSRADGAPARDGSQPQAPQFLWVAAFSGAEPPGPRATRARLCGAFLFLREIAA